MNINGLKASFCSAVGAFGGIITSLFGGWTSSMSTLVICMAIDYITGLFVAGVFKQSTKTISGGLNSKISFKGLCKKATMLLIVILAYRIDVELGIDYVKTSVCIGFIINEVISIIENCGLMGLKLPKVVSDAIDLLTKKGEK